MEAKIGIKKWHKLWFAIRNKTVHAPQCREHGRWYPHGISQQIVISYCVSLGTLSCSCFSWKNGMKELDRSNGVVLNWIVTVLLSHATKLGVAYVISWHKPDLFRFFHFLHLLWATFRAFRCWDLQDEAPCPMEEQMATFTALIGLQDKHM